MPQATRGELWVIDLGMAQKSRPCLILSIAYLDDERAVVTYVPRTTSLRNTRFEVPHQMRGFEPGAFALCLLHFVRLHRSKQKCRRQSAEDQVGPEYTVQPRP